jgi:hypothetical protein
LTINVIPYGVRGNKRGKEERLRIVSEIRKLQFTKNDYEIMDILGIPNSTYYRYKSRINKQDQEIWEKIVLDSLESRALKILFAFKEAYTISKEIAENKEGDTKYRIEACKMMIKAQVNMYYLLKQGPDLNGPPY